MTTQAILAARLRRLIDDVGHGYSQSAPGFSTDIAALAAPALEVQIDGDLLPTQIVLGASTYLTSGPAIAAALQGALRSQDPGLLLLPPTPTPGWSNASVTFDQKDGYVLRSGTLGTTSRIRVLPPTTGDNAAEALYLGATYGGYETTPALDLTDADLTSLLDAALDEQNSVGTPSSWDYSTLPKAYETLVVYRAWAQVIDIRLGRSAELHWQKVESEEQHGDQIFANYLKLADWLKKRIDALQDSLDGLIQVGTVSRWDMQTAGMIPTEVFKDRALDPEILSVSWLSPTEVMLEFREMLATTLQELHLGYRTAAGLVVDRSVFTDLAYDGRSKGFVSPSVLARTLRSGRNTLVRLVGLQSTVETKFALVALDTSGNRYYSNEVVLPAAL